MTDRIPQTTDIVARLRAYCFEDFDTSATITRDGDAIAEVTMIREASDLVEVMMDAALEIEGLRGALAYCVLRHPAYAADVCRIMDSHLPPADHTPMTNGDH